MKTTNAALTLALLAAPSMAFVAPVHHRSTPNTSLQSLFRELDDFFDSDPFFNRNRRRSMLPSSSLLKRALALPYPVLEPTDLLRRSSPRYDITENEGEYKIAVDVPGVKAENIKVEVLPAYQAIRMTGNRKDGNVESYFQKSFRLGKEIDTSNLKATVSDGVLLVTLPKNKELKETFEVPVLAIESDETGLSKEVDVTLETAASLPVDKMEAAVGKDQKQGKVVLEKSEEEEHETIEL